jgi:glucose dehydrogenase
MPPRDGRTGPAYGRTASEQRYSPLDQINADNVAKQLGVALGRWTCPTSAP